jgi:hypothetical protein
VPPVTTELGLERRRRVEHAPHLIDRQIRRRQQIPPDE